MARKHGFFRPHVLGLTAISSTTLRDGAKYNPQQALGSKLLAWWDADHTDLITQAGGVVSAWADRVQGLTHTASGAGQPAYSTSGFAGRPVITGDGTGTFMTRAGTTGLPTNSDQFEIWTLFDQTLATDGGGSRRYLFAWGGQGTQVHLMTGVTRSATNRGRVTAGNGTTAPTLNDAVVDLTGRHFQRSVFTATGIKVAVDGFAMSAETAVVRAIDTLRSRIFANTTTTPSEFWQGGLAAILVTSLLTDGEAAALTAWLSSRRSV
jgi:hypothetical protein